MKINGFNFSPGNSKLGKIWNFSLPPIKSCPKGVPCAKDCYAMRAYRMYKGTKKAWDANLKALKRDADKNSHHCNCKYWDFYNKTSDWLIDLKPRYFRIHVAGDFINQNYLNTWNLIAQENPATKFLAFTKNTELDYSNLPKNLVIRFSMWPGWDLSQRALMPSLTCPGGETLRSWRKLPRAWMDPCNGSKGAWSALGLKHCPGSCKICKYCWNSTGDVVFKKH